MTNIPISNLNPDTDSLGLGLDSGGTQTRWALAHIRGTIIAEGVVGAMSGLMMSSAGGRAQVKAVLSDLAFALRGHARPSHVYAGMTGFDEDGRAIAALVGDALNISAAQVTISNDIEIAYHDCFAPGEGYVVYAGTGSVSAFIDAAGRLHRAGGRGALLDDAGGGYWIAREALRHIWRAEDEMPGTWRASPMATAVFEKIGGSDWATTRDFVYGGHFGDSSSSNGSDNRGNIGRLAIAVAAAAGQDPAALKILRAAGVELARLATAMSSQFGPRPIALTGRAFELHPEITLALQTTLADAAENTKSQPVSITAKASQPHIAAARIAASLRTHQFSK